MLQRFIIIIIIIIILPWNPWEDLGMKKHQTFLRHGGYNKVLILVGLAKSIIYIIYTGQTAEKHKNVESLLTYTLVLTSGL